MEEQEFFEKNHIYSIVEKPAIIIIIVLFAGFSMCEKTYVKAKRRAKIGLLLFN